MNLLAALDTAVEEATALQSVDMTETGTMGTRVTLPEGRYNARLIGYFEMGKQVFTYAGKTKPATETARFEFQVYHEGESVDLLSWSISIGTNVDKSKAKKFFDGLRKVMPVVNGKDFRFFAQALGQVFSIKITADEKDGKINNNVVWETVEPAVKFNGATGEKNIIPELNVEDIRYLLWNSPTKEQWDAIYIDGVRENGSSKNFLQEEILTKATNFDGSKLDLLINGSSGIPAPQDGDNTVATAIGIKPE